MFSHFSPPDNALPPDQVRFTKLEITPWPDGERVKVSLELTPFQQPPNLVLVINDHEKNEVSRILFIEAQETIMTFTMHIRASFDKGDFSLTASVAYPGMEEFNPSTITFSIPATSEE